MRERETIQTKSKKSKTNKQTKKLGDSLTPNIQSKKKPKEHRKQLCNECLRKKMTRNDIPNNFPGSVNLPFRNIIRSLSHREAFGAIGNFHFGSILLRAVKGAKTILNFLSDSLMTW